MAAHIEKLGPLHFVDSFHQEQLDAIDQAAKRLSFLSEASRRLSSALTDQQCYQHLLELIVPDFCDFANIVILTKQGDIKRIALTHIDPKQYEIAKIFLDRYPATIQDPYGAGLVIRTSKPQFEPNFDTRFEELAKLVPYPEAIELLRTMNIRSRICVPLQSHEKPMGALWMAVTGSSNRRFTEDDLNLAQDIANRAAIALHHLQRYQTASKELERLQIETELRENYLSQIRHDVLSILTTASLSAETIARRDPNQFGTLANRILDSIRRVSEVLKNTNSGRT